jgi:hypothetical protein
MTLEPVVSPLGAALAEACVEHWLSQLNEETRPDYRSDLRQFLEWLWGRPEWTGKTPTEFLAWQDQAKGRERIHPGRAHSYPSGGEKQPGR